VSFGLVTSLSGIVMTGVSAADGHPHLAYRNAVGGIAVQTLAIVAADAAYRRVNLEHAAASVPNLLFGCLLIVLLSTALLAAFTPEITVLGGHGGQDKPMWRAVNTRETRPDVPASHDRLDARSTASLWTGFLAIAPVVIMGGWAVGYAAETLIVRTGLTAGFIGAGPSRRSSAATPSTHLPRRRGCCLPIRIVVPRRGSGRVVPDRRGAHDHRAARPAAPRPVATLAF
jgi:cation:H+ antiporter